MPGAVGLLAWRCAGDRPADFYLDRQWRLQRRLVLARRCVDRSDAGGGDRCI